MKDKTLKQLEGLLFIMHICVRMENKANTERDFVWFPLEDFSDNAKVVDKWVKDKGWWKWSIDEDNPFKFIIPDDLL